MKTQTRIVTVIALMLTSDVSIAESTISQPITRISYNAGGDYYYFEGESKWGAPSCPNASFVWFASSLAGYKQLYATLLAAYLAGKSTMFAGNCHTDPTTSQ